MAAICPACLSILSHGKCFECNTDTCIKCSDYAARGHNMCVTHLKGIGVRVDNFDRRLCRECDALAVSNSVCVTHGGKEYIAFNIAKNTAVAVDASNRSNGDSTSTNPDAFTSKKVNRVMLRPLPSVGTVAREFGFGRVKTPRTLWSVK